MTPASTTAEFRAAVFAALGAYLIWGVIGVYFKALTIIGPLEMLSHRILGGAVFVLIVHMAIGRLSEILAIFRDLRLVAGLAASALAVAVNWGVFIWAVVNGRALEASLGYFIFPLVSLLLARVFLGERLEPRQQAAVGLVALGVGWQVVHGFGLPWVALVLAVSFGLYGLLRKTIPVQALGGLFVETALLSPLAAIYLMSQGGGAAVEADAATVALLALAGPITAIPLALFSFGARRLRLSTMGLMMYLNPTVQMLVAVFLFGEAFTAIHAVTFAAIWCGLLIYSWPARSRTA